MDRRGAPLGSTWCTAATAKATANGSLAAPAGGACTQHATGDAHHRTDNHARTRGDATSPVRRPAPMCRCRVRRGWTALHRDVLPTRPAANDTPAHGRAHHGRAQAHHWAAHPHHASWSGVTTRSPLRNARSRPVHQRAGNLHRRHQQASSNATVSRTTGARIAPPPDRAGATVRRDIASPRHDVATRGRHGVTLFADNYLGQLLRRRQFAE